MPSTREHLIKLHQMLASHFNKGELKTLCFYLGIDYDDLPGEGKADKARELISYVERHGRVLELVDVVNQLRP